MSDDVLLITSKGKNPIRKTPMGKSTQDMIRLINECVERSSHEDEQLTVCSVNELKEIRFQSAREFKDMFGNINSREE